MKDTLKLVTYKSGKGSKAPAKTYNTEDYIQFLKDKAAIATSHGFDIDESEINPILKPHQKLMVKWAIRGGRRALFASFGLGKTIVQLEILRLILKHKGGRALVTLPLGVRQEFIHDASEILNLKVKFIRSLSEAEGSGIYLTNYETVRDGKIDPSQFTAASLDEGSVLRGFGGTKTFREFMRLFENVPYRFVATATPSPNEFKELLAYSAWLGIMDVSQAKTRFFKRDSTKADNLIIHPHKEEEFWLWVASWALFVQKPSDITLNAADDIGYDLPEMVVNWHEVRPSDNDAGEERYGGQRRMFRDASVGLSEAAREKRESLHLRIDKAQSLLAQHPNDHCILWHDLESERAVLEKEIDGIKTVYGSQDLDEREQNVVDFSNGKYQYIGAKPVMLGSGCNLQRHCHWAIFLGIGFKFNDFIQAIHRIQRFLQQHTVRIDLLYTEGERQVRKQLERKWKQHEIMAKKMTEIVKKYGLSEIAMAQSLVRSLGVERVEIKGNRYTLVNNDNVLEMKNVKSDSIGLMLTSIPFATQYEYSPNYADFGHTDDAAHFFLQMDFLTPELYRSLIPGRVLAVHVKDRIVPGGLTGLGFQTVYPFHKDCIDHYCKHGFGYMGMKTIVTDVVRENNQTYRLGWTEQCKDGSKMGYGMPEYLLLFRKPPTDHTDAYSDIPVVKEKDKYTRTRWQVDAHGFTRSNGDRMLTPEELKELKHDAIFQLFKKYSLEKVYDFEHHVKLGEALEAEGRLPTSFMLLQPPSWHSDVWTDITRMLTLNGAQSAAGKEMHLCPMQFDIADRVITQMSNEGDIVLDPFAGLGTVPLRAIKLGRVGFGIELSKPYFIDSASYCKAAEYDMDMPGLFDTLD
jgi:hypothetical protein